MLLLEEITIGLPFCAFKCVSGLLFKQPWLVALGIIDLLINLTNIASFIILSRKVFDACFLSFLVRFLKKPNPAMTSRWQDLGNSIDVVLSFAIVAIVIGGGFIQDLPSDLLMIWNISVILNVFGAGVSRLTNSIRNLQE